MPGYFKKVVKKKRRHSKKGGMGHIKPKKTYTRKKIFKLYGGKTRKRMRRR